MAQIKADLTSVKLQTDRLGVFKFETGDKLDLNPGQYATLGILDASGVPIKDGRGRPIFRPYSIASAPQESHVELYVAHVTNGGDRPDGTGWLTNELFTNRNNLQFKFASPKAKGTFLLPEEDKTVLMIATGTGLAPYISMLRDAKIRGDKRHFALAHSVSSKSDLVYRKELEVLTSELDFSYFPIVSREQCDECHSTYIGGLFFHRNNGGGRISQEEVTTAVAEGRTKNPMIEDLLQQPLMPDQVHVMLCGNPAMIGNMKTLLAERQYEKGRGLSVEEYWTPKEKSVLA